MSFLGWVIVLALLVALWYFIIGPIVKTIVIRTKLRHGLDIGMSSEVSTEAIRVLLNRNPFCDEQRIIKYPAPRNGYLFSVCTGKITAELKTDGYKLYANCLSMQKAATDWRNFRAVYLAWAQTKRLVDYSILYLKGWDSEAAAMHCYPDLENEFDRWADRKLTKTPALLKHEKPLYLIMFLSLIMASIGFFCGGVSINVLDTQITTISSIKWMSGFTINLGIDTMAVGGSDGLAIPFIAIVFGAILAFLKKYKWAITILCDIGAAWFLLWRIRFADAFDFIYTTGTVSFDIYWYLTFIGLVIAGSVLWIDLNYFRTVHPEESAENGASTEARATAGEAGGSNKYTESASK